MNSSLLQHSPYASHLARRPVYLYREDLYWSRVGLPRLVEHPVSDPALLWGGSKMRMFDKVWWEGARSIATTGVVQSNQVRQLALYARMHSELRDLPIYAMVAPDLGHVDPAAEMERDSLRAALDVNPNLSIRVLTTVAAGSEELPVWCRTMQAVPGCVFLPRGMACPAGVAAAFDIGQDVERHVGSMLLGSGLDVLLISGSGSTHLGVSRGLSALIGTGHANVTGLTTRHEAGAQLERLKKRDPTHPVPLWVTDDFALAGGGPCAESDASVDSWTDVLGVELDRGYCGRLCQRLDEIVASGDTSTRDLVLIVTGTEKPRES